VGETSKKTTSMASNRPGRDAFYTFVDSGYTFVGLNCAPNVESIPFGLSATLRQRDQIPLRIRRRPRAGDVRCHKL
jgi:hypothetical protein